MVRRYEFKAGDENEASEMVERQNGDWVMADDYDAVVEERDDLRKIIADAAEVLRTA